MKKCCCFLLTLLIFSLFTNNVSASTIPINISPGYIIQISSSPDDNNLRGDFEFDLQDKLALSLEYVSVSNYYSLLGRYSFVKNMAVGFSFSSSNPAAWNIDFRMRRQINESLAVAGILGYNGVTPNLTGQVEDWFTDQLAGNVGFAYQNSATSLVLGTEFLIERMDIGLDLYVPAGNTGQIQVAAFWAYQL